MLTRSFQPAAQLHRRQRRHVGEGPLWVSPAGERSQGLQPLSRPKKWPMTKVWQFLAIAYFSLPSPLGLLAHNTNNRLRVAWGTPKGGWEAMGPVPQARAGRQATSEGQYKNLNTFEYKCIQFEYKRH